MSEHFLADACALLAYFGGTGSRMSPEGMAAMRANVGISALTVWELTRKAAIGKLPPLPEEGGSFAAYLAGEGFTLVPLLWEDGEKANRLPPLHKDPMDRMLVAQALRLGLPVITEDGVFRGYGVRTIW